MPKVTLAPLVGDVRGKLGNVYFTNRYGQPVLCKFTPAKDQQSPNRVHQRDVMRVVARWWMCLPDQVKDYCDLLAEPSRLSGYDVFTKRNIIDINDYPNPPFPRILPLEAPLPVLKNYVLYEDVFPDVIIAFYDLPEVEFPLLCVPLAVKMLGENLSCELLWSSSWLWDSQNGVVVLDGLQAETTYAVFVVLANYDLTVFGVASAFVGKTSKE